MRTYQAFKDFIRDRSGVAAIEFSFVFPVMLTALIATVGLYQLFRDSKLAEKSTFTVADVVSRRTTVDNTFLKTSHELFLKMTGRDASHSQFRISSIKKDAGKYSVQWSYAIAPMAGLATASIPVTKLPLLSDGDSLILVETEVTPPEINNFLPLTIGNYENAQFARPRFTAAVVKTN